MPRINIIIYSIFFIISFTSVLQAEVPCLKILNNKETNLEEVIKHCNMQKVLASDPIVKKDHRSKIHLKLAEKLATQITQTSEELAILTNFFEMNGKILGQNSQEINNKCKLEKINETIKCKNNNNNSTYETKLSSLKSFLPSNKHTQFHKDQSLYGLVAGKFSTDLGVSNLNNDNQCPLDEKSGAFLIKGQLDEMSSSEIVKNLNTTALNSNDEIFKDYAQLKLINESQDPELKKIFKEYIKNIPKDANAKKYISDFFLNPSFQPKLTNLIANKCEKTLSNIKTFMCEELDELASLDNSTSAKLFNKLSTKKPLEDQYTLDIKDPEILTAYGMQCLAKEKNLTSVDTLNNKLSLDKWFSDFTTDTRPVTSDVINQQDVKLFCSMYNCKSDQVSKTSFCSKGGPLSSKQLDTIFKCGNSPKGENCNFQIHKYIDLLESIENIKNNALGITNEIKIQNDKSDSKEISKRRLPVFAENFLGAEGTLKVLGVEVTPKIIAEKRLDIENKNKETTNTSLSISQNKIESKSTQTQNTNNDEAATQVSAIHTADRIASAPTYARAIAPTPKSAVNSNNYKVQPTPAASTESTRLRREMEDMLKDLKSNPNLAVANSDSGTSDTNSATSPSDSSSTKKQASGSTTIKSRAEEERLERYAKQLDQRERDLNDYKDKLDNQAYSRTVSDDSNESQKSLLPKSGIAGTSASSDTAGSNSTSSGSSSSGSNGSSSLKLSAANPKAEQKTNTAAIIQSGKETSTLSVEELTTLSSDNLQNLGIDSTKPFTLRVNFKAKTYEVPVKTLLYKGRNILGPVIDPKNIDLKDMLLKSPLFRPFQEYRLEREKAVI